MITSEGMFVGFEVEHTNQLDQKTLFVATANSSQIDAALQKDPSIRHIYFGAGGTGAPIAVELVKHYLERGFSATVEVSGLPSNLGNLLLYPTLTVILPLTLLGVSNLDTRLIPSWLDTPVLCQVFIKVDTDEINCWQIPLSVFAERWTRPHHYKGDTLL